MKIIWATFLLISALSLSACTSQKIYVENADVRPKWLNGAEFSGPRTLVVFAERQEFGGLEAQRRVAFLLASRELAAEAGVAVTSLLSVAQNDSRSSAVVFKKSELNSDRLVHQAKIETLDEWVDSSGGLYVLFRY